MGDTDWINHCARLEFLDVSQNILFGDFPANGLSQLNNLRTLDISDNRLFGFIDELPENIRVARMHNNLFSFPLDDIFRAHAPIHLGKSFSQVMCKRMSHNLFLTSICMFMIFS
jgi:hypothetical protein